ncbi:Tubulin-tyrosine ligase family [Bernardetia litoralis DSM 6794]|uniref:Tubulin-tyrosine ligase family n=1 Tax=Bernardetia litoralis (strain ATCC 23117 / DSM 6794 / NBRC 15988 / NCIMB 1366 / Fx l1 / Sio-4) TaxID=880071 RepID=I4ALZ2_BERLS|nr:Tubulin-tyrosine ligase family [Bernardetia litoralis]AFM04977.1 Tubulin-tyrosine ligase family [Bernardetia litoralis DSM 6794]
MKKPLWWIKMTNFEYWSFWFFYLPTVPYGLYLALRSGSLAYFTSVNPAVPLSGLQGQPKQDILKLLDEKYLPKSLYFKHNSDFEFVKFQIEKKQIKFPFIIKPEVGERGKGVEKMDSFKELQDYLNEYTKENKSDFIIQEFLKEPIELGVLYYRLPNNLKSKVSGEEEKIRLKKFRNSAITSIVQKEFLTVIGDGKKTLSELIGDSDRARFQKKRLQKEFAQEWNVTIPINKKIILEHIGNHCRGTKFVDANYLVTEKNIAAFDEIMKSLENYYYGRFDIKVSSMEDFKEGKGIKIMEVNGVASEPAHIYDPKTPILKAYRDILWHMKIIQVISFQNKKDGTAFASFSQIWKIVSDEFKKTFF